MDLGEALLDALGGGEADDEYEDQDDWREHVIDLYGSVARASRDLGVPRSTLRGWLAGRTPKGTRSQWFVAELRQAGRERSMSGRLDELRSLDPRSIRITGTYQYNAGGSMKGTENRDVPIGDWLDDRVMDRLVDAYLDGATPDELAEVFAEHITDGGFYAETFGPGGDGTWDVHSIDGFGL